MENKMNITILGSGTSVPSLHRSSCSVFVDCGRDKLLFDCGAGTIRRLLEIDIRINAITHLFLSHFHPDHCGELVSFLFSLKAPELRREGHVLNIVAGDGFLDFYNGLRNVFGKHVECDEGRLSIMELSIEKKDRIEFDGFSTLSVPVMHNRESLAFRIEKGRSSFVYSGDTDYCDSLIGIAGDAGVFVCECSSPDQFKKERHLTPSLAGLIATKARVKKLVLTHFYPECDKTDIAKECRKTYDGPLFLAEDLMNITL